MPHWLFVSCLLFSKSESIKPCRSGGFTAGGGAWPRWFLADQVALRVSKLGLEVLAWAEAIS